MPDPRSADGGPQDGGRVPGLRRPQRGDMPVRGRPPPPNRLPARGTSPGPGRLAEGGRPPEARGRADRGDPGAIAGRGQTAGNGPHELVRRPQARPAPELGRIPAPRPPGARRPPEQNQVPGRSRTAGTRQNELARRPQPRRKPELGPGAPLRPPRPRRPPEPSQVPGRGRISVPRRLPERYRTLEARVPEAISVRLRDARDAFRVWRRTRPFWGGLLITCGASEILLSELGPLQVVVHIGAKGLAGYIVPVMLLLCGILIWFNPAQRAYNSLFAMVLALLSWITSNLGGFFIGMLLSLVGGALAFAWTPDPERQPLRRPQSTPQMRHPSWRLALTLRPVAALPPPPPVESSLAGRGPGAARQPPGSAEKTAPEGPRIASPGRFRALVTRLASRCRLPRRVREAVLSEYGRLSAIFTDRRPRS